jgi:oligosaccharide repeat unit polymerase
MIQANKILPDDVLLKYEDRNSEEYGLFAPAFRLDAFRRDAFRSLSPSYFAFLFLFLMMSSSVFWLTSRQSYSAIWPNQVVYYLILTFHIGYRLKKSGTLCLLSPDSFFLLLYTLFHLGYVTLFSMNIVPSSAEIFYYEQSIPKSMYVINLGIIGFLCGFEFMAIKRPKADYVCCISIPSFSWKIFGLGVILLGLIMHLLGLVMLGFDTISIYGYEAIQNSFRYANYLTVLILSFSVPAMGIGITIYAISSALRDGKLNSSSLGLGLIASCFIIVILEGDRGPIVSFGIVLLIIRHFFIKPVKIRVLLILALAAVFLFAFLGVVRTVVFSPDKMLAEYQQKRSEGMVTWYSPFVEMGGSFLVVNITTQDVPSVEPYWMGASWKDAVIHVIPFLQGYLMNLGLARWSPSQWITTTYFGPESAGRAFTVAAEGYLNLGYIGVFVETFMVGLFLRGLMIYFAKQPSVVRGLIMLGCMVPLLLVTRNNLNIVFSFCVHYSLLAFFLGLFFKNEYVFVMDHVGFTNGNEIVND